MSQQNTIEVKLPEEGLPVQASANVARLLRQYGCGSIPFVGTENAFYERHLVFDRAINPKVASARERFEAFSRSVRDILAQRWVLTKETYERTNAKRIYYLSLEFLIGRSLADPHAWARKAILNVASSGKFSSDRTINEYTSEIWKVTPCPVQ